MFVLIGTDKRRVRVMVNGPLAELRRAGDKLAFYAIYKATYKGRPFHAAVDANYLVEHKNDPYWTNRFGGKNEIQ